MMEQRDGASETHGYEQAMRILKDPSRSGVEPALENIHKLMSELDNPQQNYHCVQIAGTNGKTSTSRAIAALLGAHGCKVGLFTSPELMYYEERVEIAGKVIDRAEFAEAVAAADGAALRLTAAGEIPGITEFELLTATALWAFAQRGVDYAVLEAGMGGRWDATSVVCPSVAVLTGVDFDHTAILGTTIKEIALEKAAIIKPGSVAVVGPVTEPVKGILARQAASVGAPLIEAGEVDILPILNGIKMSSHLPDYQAVNVAVAIKAAEAATASRLDIQAAQRAIDDLVLPGRFELIRQLPPLLIDVAHNPQAARYLAQALRERFGVSRLNGGVQLNTMDTLLLGVLSDKDVSGVVEALAPLFRRVVVTQSHSPRALAASDLARIVEKHTGFVPDCTANIPEAMRALTSKGAAVVATGSTTVAGEVKAWAARGFA
jgi:dihydrofolate synthase/folylpolyglutamate synthase